MFYLKIRVKQRLHFIHHICISINVKNRRLLHLLGQTLCKSGPLHKERNLEVVKQSATQVGNISFHAENRPCLWVQTGGQHRGERECCVASLVQ